MVNFAGFSKGRDMKINIIGEDNTKKASDSAKRNLSGVSDAAANITKTLAIAATAASASIGLVVAKSIQAASDLQETQGKFSVVFRGNMEAAESFADELAESYIMSENAAKSYMSTMQDMLKPMGMAGDEATVLSSNVVKLAADLASFNNVPVADTLRAIRSAMVGEFEPMRQFGTMLSVATIEAEALSRGLIQTKDELTPLIKATLAYELALENNTDANGDAIRTAGSYANQVKKLQAGMDDLAATIGEDLLPKATEYVELLNEWVEANGEVIAKDISGFIEDTHKGISAIVKTYQDLPPLVKASGVGVVGALLFGWQSALLFSYLNILYEAQRVGKELGNDVYDFLEKVKGATGGPGAHAAGMAEYRRRMGLGEFAEGFSQTAELPQPGGVGEIGGGVGIGGQDGMKTPTAQMEQSDALAEHNQLILDRRMELNTLLANADEDFFSGTFETRADWFSQYYGQETEMTASLFYELDQRAEALEAFYSTEIQNTVKAGNLKKGQWAKDAKTAAHYMSSITAAAASENKIMFQINKAAAVSSAILDTHEAITGAYKVGARIGGPPLGAAFAAIAGAAQAVQVASILGTEYGGGSTPSSVGGAGSATIQDQERDVVQPISDVVEQPRQQDVVQINDNRVYYDIRGDVVELDELARKLITPLAQAEQDGVRAEVS